MGVCSPFPHPDLLPQRGKRTKACDAATVFLGIHREPYKWGDELVKALRRHLTAGPPYPIGNDLGAQDLLNRCLHLRREGLMFHALLDVLIDPLLVPHLDGFEGLAFNDGLRFLLDDGLKILQ